MAGQRRNILRASISPARRQAGENICAALAVSLSSPNTIGVRQAWRLRAARTRVAPAQNFRQKNNSVKKKKTSMVPSK